MIHPSYTELMEKINKEGETGEEPVINSRYSIVIATSKRAREIIGGDEPLVNGMEGEKPLSIAVKELYDSKIKILPGDEENMEDEEHLSSDEFEELGEVDPAFTNVEYEGGRQQYAGSAFLCKEGGFCQGRCQTKSSINFISGTGNYYAVCDFSVFCRGCHTFLTFKRGGMYPISP